MNMLHRKILIVFFILIPGGLSPAIDPQQSIDSAHAEIWKRFVDPYNIVLDYTALDGSIIRPTPEECRELKPSALSWGVPSEDGPMFNGLYLDAMCSCWKLTHNQEDLANAKRLVDGLIFLASVSDTPGFIARGVATDGKTTYPMGSNDQTTPWIYGMWRFMNDGLANEQEREQLTNIMLEVITALEQSDWKMPCSGPPSKYRGDLLLPSWEGAPRILFVMKAMHQLTGQSKWHDRYLETANANLNNDGLTRLEVCRKGLVFDPNQGARHSWTGSVGVSVLRALWEMETDPHLKSVYEQGLKSSAELCAGSLSLIDRFDVDGTEHFENDWHVMNSVWKPQHSEADAVAVANAGLRAQSKASPRLHLEKDYMREPCFAAWVITLCPDQAFVRSQRPAIEKVITHYKFDRLHLSQFFPLESAWYRLRLMD